MELLLAGILDTVMPIAMIVALFFIMPLIMLKAWKAGHLKTFWGAFVLLASILITTALVKADGATCHVLCQHLAQDDRGGGKLAIVVDSADVDAVTNRAPGPTVLAERVAQ